MKKLILIALCLTMTISLEATHVCYKRSVKIVRKLKLKTLEKLRTRHLYMIAGAQDIAEFYWYKGRYEAFAQVESQLEAMK